MAKPKEQYKLEKELREARAEIQEDREIRDRLMAEIRELKSQAQEGLFRGECVREFLQAQTHSTVILRKLFSLPPLEERK